MINLDVVVSMMRLNNFLVYLFIVLIVGVESGKIKGDFDDVDNVIIKLVYIDNMRKCGDRYVNFCG